MNCGGSEDVQQAAARMRQWASEHGEADTQGLMDEEWLALARAALQPEEREHDGYALPVNGGYSGYAARCWDCDWKGCLYSANPDGKRHAKTEAMYHSRNNKIACCSRCRLALTEEEA